MSTPRDVTAVSRNAGHAKTDVTAPSSPPTHPENADSWETQEEAGSRLPGRRRLLEGSEYQNSVAKM